jgi:long-subunit fatty acid transport protein
MQEQHRLMFALDINKLLVPTPPVITGDSATDADNLFNYRNQGVVASWINSFSDAPGGFSEELKEFTFSLAAEYGYQEKFFVRAGYYYEHPTKGNRKYATAGIGLKINEKLGIDFSYLVPSGSGTNRNPLSNTLRFGISFDFANVEN